MPDNEPIEALLRLLPLHTDLGNPGAGRAAMTPGDQLLEIVPGALGDELDRAVGTISDPSGQA